MQTYNKDGIRKLYVVGEKMMDKEQIIDSIEKFINEEIDEYNPSHDSDANTVESALENVAVRLVNTYKKYRGGDAGLSDYISVLRSFMLSFQTELRVEDHGILDNNYLGIHFNPSSQKYYATYEVQHYVKYKSFVEKTFVNIDSTVPESNCPYCLDTNMYIYELTSFKQFKSIEQKLCVYGALNTPDGYTTLISMQTGGGKSLVTQAVSYKENGLSIVIVPTVSLAIDQKRVARKNIKTSADGEIFYYYSGCKKLGEISKAIKNKVAKLLFISPEALIKNEQFQELINEANANRYLKNIIIDEAHIVVAWGDFFRVDYQCLGPWRKELLRTNPDIKTFLLSATFKDDTVRTLKKIFSEEEKWIELRCDSLRKEPHFILVMADGYKDKKRKVLSIVNLMPKPMILYVNAPHEAEKWKKYLQYFGYANIRTFTGETKSDERLKVIEQWSDNQYEIMIATSAFGVGVDKPDVRSVVHLYVPESPDSYYQELGRGGRDGLQSLSIVCIEKDDVSKAFNHVSKVLTTQKLWGRWWSMYKNPDNMWKGGEIAVFASTKPNYSRINYFEEGNDTDEKWNINVLLLLSRYDMISISSIELDNNNKYIFTIRILNEAITHDSESTFKLFDSIRKKEASKSLSAFSLMRNAIERESSYCWSSMFYDTYPLVSEYCPGCGQHEEVICDEENRFPLLVEVRGPGKCLPSDMDVFFSDTNEALLFTKDTKKKRFIDYYKPDIVVSEEKSGCDETSDPGLIYMNFKELRTLMKYDQGFFVTGLIMAIYSDDPNKAVEEYDVMRKCIQKGNKVIHIAASDFIVSKSSGKTISLDIDGKVVE